MTVEREASQHRMARACVRYLLVAIGLLLLAAAFATGPEWLARHFLPEHRPQPRLHQVAGALRVGVALLGVAVVALVRPRVEREIAAGLGLALLGRTVRNVLAIVLALLTSELILQRIPDPHFQREGRVRDDPAHMHRRDAQLGWTMMAAHTGHDRRGGREVDYAFDEHGCRVADASSRVDPAQPTLVFVGESYVLGAGLLWSETLPARMAATFDVQSANCAVDAYSSDQQYMRLEEELPRFQHPVAVVALFATWLFVRNLDTDRPRLDADFQWHEARLPWRLEALAKRVVPYHSNAAIDRAVTMTRAMLRGTLELARSRGAVPLILVPQFLPETASDREIRRRVLDQAGIPYVFVPLDSGWRIPGDAHPNAHANDVMVQALAERLRQALPPVSTAIGGTAGTTRSIGSGRSRSPRRGSRAGPSAVRPSGRSR
jgi:hypothetical protein